MKSSSYPLQLARVVACLLLLCLPGFAAAKGVALILTISDYGADLPRLDGVVHDRANADVLATQLGVAPEDRLYFSDGELTRDGFDKAFAALAQTVADGDSVFIYYSGHGFRTQKRDAEAGVCVSSLVGADRRSYPEDELLAQVQRIAARAMQVVVMIDACHAGGAVEAQRVLTRALPADGGREFRARVFTPPEGDTCRSIANIAEAKTAAWRSLPGSGGDNVVIIAAARPDEVSVEDPAAGGLATSSLVSCLKTAKDLDASGIITFRELLTCGQSGINSALGAHDRFRPHHLTLAGNASRPFAPALPQQMPPEPPASGGEKSAPEYGEACGQVTVSAENLGSGKAAAALLQDLFHGRDDRRVVTVTTPKKQLAICKDKLEFTVSSSHDGFLYVLQLGSDGRTFNLLYPNDIDTRDNAIKAAQPIDLPGDAFDLVMQGPPGKDRILVVVSESRRSFRSVNVSEPGAALSSYATGANERMGLTRALTRVRCKQTECQGSYGAALLEIEEVP